MKLPLLIIIAALFAYSLGWAEANLATLENRLLRSHESFANVLGAQTGTIPAEILAKAKGILIFREYGAGFFFGGKGGFGVAMARQDNGNWGAPAFLKIGEGSFGLQIGVQRLDIVFLFMKKEAMRVFEKGKFRFGVDATAAVGPSGAKAEAKIGAPVLVYSDAEGLFAGAAFEGGVLAPDEEANELYYNKVNISVPDVIYNPWLKSSDAAAKLRSVLSRYERGEYSIHYDDAGKANQQREQDWGEKPWQRAGGPGR